MANENVMNALRKGDLAELERLLAAGVPVDRKYDWGWPLHLAVRSGHSQTVKRVLMAGARVDQADKSGETALMVAARDGASSVAEILLGHSANPNLQDPLGRTALMISLERRFIPIASVLARVSRLDVRDASGCTSIDYAVYFDIIDAVDWGDQQRSHGWIEEVSKAILRRDVGLAAADGDVATLQRLLTDGEEVDLKILMAGRRCIGQFWRGSWRPQRCCLAPGHPRTAARATRRCSWRPHTEATQRWWSASCKQAHVRRIGGTKHYSPQPILHLREVIDTFRKNYVA